MGMQLAWPLASAALVLRLLGILATSLHASDACGGGALCMLSAMDCLGPGLSIFVGALVD